MLPAIGSIVYTDGNRPVLVLGYAVDDSGAETGALYVGGFATVEECEQGYYGAQPGPKGLKPSEVPASAITTAPAAATVPQAPALTTPSTSSASSTVAPIDASSSPSSSILDTAEPVAVTAPGEAAAAAVASIPTQGQ